MNLPILLLLLVVVAEAVVVAVERDPNLDLDRGKTSIEE
jgi:hypothetical protein